jgi:cysteine desulfurase
MDPEVVEIMVSILRDRFGNPSSLHRLGADAGRVLREARQTVADALSVDPDEIIFTGGGTEADNIGIRGAALSASPKRKHALLFALEHPAVREQRSFLEDRGFVVEEIPSLTNGICDLDALETLIRPAETALVAVMLVNNEIGTIQPLAEIGDLMEDQCPEAALHVDAVQAFTKMPVRPRAFRATTVALAGHKFHGPKGVGVLYARKKSRITPLVVGGGQERGLRPGTENVAAIAGFAKATELGMEHLQTDAVRMTELRDWLIDTLCSDIDDVVLNGDPVKRLCNNVNVNVRGARSEILLHALEDRGIFVSSGSACHASKKGPSHVLRAIGLSEEDTGCLRITLSRFTTEDEVRRCADALSLIVPEARP